MLNDEKIFESVITFYKHLEGIVTPVRTIPALLFVHDYQIRMFRKHTYRLEINGSEIHMWVLAYIAKEIIRCSSPIFGYKHLSMKDIISIHMDYYRCLDPLADSKLDFTKSEDLAPLFLIWTTYEQLFWQEPIRNILPRSLMIYGLHSPSKMDGICQELHRRFFDLYDISLSDFIFVGFCLWGMFIRNNGIDRMTLFDTSIEHYKKILSTENIKKSLAIMEETRSEFQTRCNESVGRDHPFKKYMLNDL